MLLDPPLADQVHRHLLFEVAVRAGDRGEDQVSDAGGADGLGDVHAPAHLVLGGEVGRGAGRADRGLDAEQPQAPSAAAAREATSSIRARTTCAPARAPCGALFTWLRAVGAHAVANRGLGASLMRGGDPTLGGTCHDMIINAGDTLLARARTAGAVRTGIAVTHLLKLVSAIALATEQDPDGPAEADRLLAIAIDGIRAH